VNFNSLTGVRENKIYRLTKEIKNYKKLFEKVIEVREKAGKKVY